MNGSNNPNMEPKKVWTDREMDGADGMTIHELFNQGTGLTYNDFSMHNHNIKFYLQNKFS